MHIRLRFSIVIIIVLLSSCRTTKFVPDGEYLLDKVNINCDTKQISKSELTEYLRQTPNAAIFGALKMQLGIYNLAGKDSTKWFNKTCKRIGDPPVIYNSLLTSISVLQLEKLMKNRGYINAKVESSIRTKGKKATVQYSIKSNKPYTLRDYSINLDNTALTEIATDTSLSLVRSNMLFDVDVFNAERERISSKFRESGYYNFNKDFLNFKADSALKSNKIDLTLELRDYLKKNSDSVKSIIYKQFSTVEFRNFSLISFQKSFVKLDALVQNTFVNPQSKYSDEAVARTYQSLNSLGPVKYVNINFNQVNDSLLDCFIIITPAKVISISTELEGTYTEGYWGGAGTLNWMHRNIFRGAEALSLQLRGAYEWQKTIWAQELGVQAGLKFPKFLFPFGSYDFKRNVRANTEFTGTYNSQFRPGEFSTQSLGAGLKYSWNRKQFRHSFELFDLNYMHFDTIYQDFRDQYLKQDSAFFNPYNYVDHFIMRIGYSGAYSSFNANRPLFNYSTMRYNIETSGNMVYAINQLLKSPTDASGAYRLFGIRFSQYLKAEYNVTHHQIFNKQNRFVYHFGAGIGAPYGNADIIPYEKRFFSGGANSIRGWSESTLGPGAYQRIDSRKRDYNQVGDIKLDMSMEYRAKLAWVAEGALFLDAGNVWTIKDYETQIGGKFKLDTFAKQIAIAYGVGLRLDFSFFIARIDLGVKLFDPSYKSRLDQWRTSPNWNDDFAVHLAIGYPF